MPKFTRLPSKEELHKLLEYRSDTGKLYWKQEYDNTKGTLYKVGDEVHLTKIVNGSNNIYYRINFLGKKYQLSRIIYKICTGKDPNGVIDHIDGNTENNRIENLRDISHSYNIRRAMKGKWVAYKPKINKSKPYEVSFRYEGKRYQLGWFKTYEDAEQKVTEWRVENKVRMD